MLVRTDFSIEFDPPPFDDGKIMVGIRSKDNRLLGQAIHEDAETALVIAIEKCYDQKPKEIYEQWKRI